MKEETITAEDLKLFQDTIQEQIKRVQDGIGINSEIAMLQDLKRLGELGILTVYSSSEIPEVKEDNGKFSVEYLQPRLMFEGEQKIVELQKEIKELKTNHRQGLINLLVWLGNGYDLDKNAEQIVDEYYETEV